MLKKSNFDSKPMLLIGAGGHAKVLADLILAAGYELLGVLDSRGQPGFWHFGLPLLGDDSKLVEYPAKQVNLALGIGSIPGQLTRRQVLARLAGMGYEFPPLVHPRAYVAREVELAAGVQVMAGAVVQPGCRLGEHVIINTRASIDHDCVLADHVHVAPGATLSGAVYVCEGAHIGTGAAVAQGRRIGDNALIGAGASIVRDVAAGARVLPAPLRIEP